MPAFPSHSLSTRPARVLRRVIPFPGLAVGFVLAASSVHGQTPGGRPHVAELIPGARALALGMAAQVGGDDPELAFVHPALAQGLSGVQGSHSWFGSGGRALSLAGAVDWFGGGVAVSLHSLDYVGLQNQQGEPRSSLDDLVVAPAGGEGVAETAATLTYARTLFGVQFGISGRLLTQRFGPDRSTAEAVDLGAATSLGPLTVALSARNLGGAEELPEEVVLGAGAYGRPLGPLDVGAAAQVRYRDDGELEVGGGVEFGYWPIRGRTFVGRVGFRNVPEGSARPVTVGGSFWGDSLVLDYAFQPMDGLDGVHRVSVGWR